MRHLRGSNGCKLRKAQLASGLCFANSTADGYLVENTQVALFPGLELIVFRPERVVLSAGLRQRSTMTARRLQVAAIALSNC